MHRDLALNLGRVSERPVPAGFQLTGDQPVRGISGIVLPESPVGGIARRFEVATESIAYLIAPLPGSLGGSGCGGDRARTDDAKQCFLDGIIDASPPKAMQWGPPLSMRGGCTWLSMPEYRSVSLRPQRLQRIRPASSASPCLGAP
ncbi:hypothetical protein ABIF97_004238 [Bradyrhizobium japonicum]